jgi:hypothetical protein
MFDDSYVLLSGNGVIESQRYVYSHEWDVPNKLMDPKCKTKLLINSDWSKIQKTI